MQNVTGYRHLRRCDLHLVKGIKKNKEGKRRMKGIVMAQWVNRLRNNIFVNPPPSTLLCEISGALHLAQPGLTAGRLGEFEILEFATDRHIRHFATFNKCTASL